MFARYFQMGGIMMWPLLICSVLLVAIIIERIWTVTVLGRIFGKNITSAQRKRTADLFVFFKDVPPSIGLLGTVIGVVQSFSLGGGRITAEAAGAGLAVACFTTIAGLTIAIVATISEYLTQWLCGGCKDSKGLDK
jgi:biopolymer transport protein ExbB/TolQ